MYWEKPVKGNILPRSWSALIKSEARIEFEERCYMTKLTFKEVQSYIQMQKKRVDDIEEVIDSHFDSIKKTILKDKSDKLFRTIKKEEEANNKERKSNGNTTRSIKSNRSNRSGGGGKN